MCINSLLLIVVIRLLSIVQALHSEWLNYLLRLHMFSVQSARLLEFLSLLYYELNANRQRIGGKA